MCPGDGRGPCRRYGTKEPFLARSHLTDAAPAAYLGFDARTDCARHSRRQTMALTTTAVSTLNGLDLAAMGTTVAALKQQPALAQFEFRARNRWISGGENRSTIKDFRGAGAEDASR